MRPTSKDLCLPFAATCCWNDRGYPDPCSSGPIGRPVANSTDGPCTFAVIPGAVDRGTHLLHRNFVRSTSNYSMDFPPLQN